MRSCGIAFTQSNAVCNILELRPDGVSAPISEVSFIDYGLLACLTSCALKCLDNWLQAIFTAQ